MSDLKRVIIYGGGSTGKTISTVTALKHANIKRLIYLQTERNSISGIAKGLEIHKIKPEAGQIITCYPTQSENPFSNLKRALTDYQTETKSSALQGGFKSNQNKDKYGFLNNILKNFEVFEGTDYVTGETVKIGNVAKLNGEEDVLIVDGLSVLSEEIWKSLVGDKILVSLDDYKPVQKYMTDLLEAMSKCVNAHLILLAHETDHNEMVTDTNGKQVSKFVRKEVDFNSGIKAYERFIGKFTDVIYAEKMGIKFVWHGNKPSVHTVARNYPAQAGLEPDFSKYSFF